MNVKLHPNFWIKVFGILNTSLISINNYEFDRWCKFQADIFQSFQSSPCRRLKFCGGNLVSGEIDQKCGFMLI